MKITVERHPTIEACIALDPSLANRRYVATSVIRSLLKRLAGQCTWCGLPVVSPLRSWCSRQCRAEAYFYVNPSLGNRAARERDMGKCVLCGAAGAEVDHIIPVIKGGGLCAVSNLRTLCITCHHRFTRALHNELTETRRRHRQ